MESSILLCLLPTILASLVTALLLLRSRKRITCKLPPGPRGLPVLGHLHLLGKLPHRSLYELSKSHGPLMFLRLGRVPVIVASSPDTARQILQTHDVAFSHRSPTAVAIHILGDGRICRDILYSPPNSYWKLLRRLCAEELFSAKRLHSFQQVRKEEIDTLMRCVLEECRAPQMMRPKLREATNNIIMRMMLGDRFSELAPPAAGGHGGCTEKQRKSILEILAEMLELSAGTIMNVRDFLPWIAWMDWQGIEKRSRSAAADMRAAFEGIVNGRRAANTEGRPPPNDFLDVLLQASSSSDTTIDIMAVFVNLFAGGTDTSSFTIEWALAELLSNPEKLRTVQLEIDNAVGSARWIEEEDINYLPFLVACVKEVMRLHPVLPLLIPHKTNQACKIMDYIIPQNTHAYVNVWAIGRDPKVWENPTKFLPERFLEVSDVDVQGQQFELLPFGSGRRYCPGWRLGLLNVQVILARLLQGFEWSTPPSHNLDMSEFSNVITSLATPLVAHATPRLSRELY